MDKITQVLFSDIGKVTTQYVEVPHQELKPHEVRIAPVFYGICGSDLHVLKGGHPFAKPPVVPVMKLQRALRKLAATLKMYSRAIMLWSIPSWLAWNAEPAKQDVLIFVNHRRLLVFAHRALLAHNTLFLRVIAMSHQPLYR